MPRSRRTEIGDTVRRLREAKGWAQQQLGEAAGVTQSHVAHIEAGRREPSLAVLQALAKALEVTTDELLREDHKREEDAQLWNP